MLDNFSSMIDVMSASGGINSMKITQRLFGSIENVGGKMSAFLSACEVHFSHYWNNDKVRQPIIALTLEITRAAMRRNDIAHGHVYSATIHSKDSDGANTEQFSGNMLVASKSMTGRNFLYPEFRDSDDLFAFVTSHYRFTSSDILDFEAKFNSLNSEIFSIAQGFRKVRHLDIPIMVAAIIFPDLNIGELEASELPNQQPPPP